MTLRQTLLPALIGCFDCFELWIPAKGIKGIGFSQRSLFFFSLFYFPDYVPYILLSGHRENLANMPESPFFTQVTLFCFKKRRNKTNQSWLRETTHSNPIRCHVFSVLSSLTTPFTNNFLRRKGNIQYTVNAVSFVFSVQLFVWGFFFFFGFLLYSIWYTLPETTRKRRRGLVISSSDTLWGLEPKLVWPSGSPYDDDGHYNSS